MAGRLCRRKTTENAQGVLGPSQWPVLDGDGQLLESLVSFRRSCVLSDNLDVRDSSSFQGQMGTPIKAILVLLTSICSKSLLRLQLVARST